MQSGGFDEEECYDDTKPKSHAIAIARRKLWCSFYDTGAVFSDCCVKSHLAVARTKFAARAVEGLGGVGEEFG